MGVMENNNLSSMVGCLETYPPPIISYKYLKYSNLQVLNSARFRAEVLSCLFNNKIILKNNG